MSEKTAAAPRVLAVDDEQGYRDLLVYELGTSGFQVETASGCDEAIRKIRQQGFDVVVTDLTMPRQSGLDALAAIKSVDPGLQIIIVTGHATLESAVESMKRGAFDFLTKPFEMDYLRRRIADAALRRRSQGTADGFERWEDFFDHSAVGICLVGGDGVVRWANRAQLELLGYQAQEYVGRPIADFHADKAAVGQVFKTLVACGELRASPARLVGKDGSIKHVLISSNVFWKDGRFIHTRCFTTAIPEPVYELLKRDAKQ